MQNRMIWFDRKFDFILSVELYPMTVERLRGTPARLEDKMSGLSTEVLTHKDGNSWSIQEQIGHLIVLEKIWDRRADDFLQGKEHLSPADLSNAETKETDFHKEAIEDLLKRFRSDREKLVEKLDRFNLESAARSALHPRLNKPMRVIDLAYFVAEHDDHHLAKMTDLIAL